MAETSDLGRLFLHRMEYPSRHFPLAELGDTQETTYPFRHARSLVVRAPFTAKAVVLGWWGDSQDEEQALLRAISLGEKRKNVQEAEDSYHPFESPTEGRHVGALQVAGDDPH